MRPDAPRARVGGRRPHRPRAGDRRRSVGVVDDHHVGVELADLAVERLDLLAVLRLADHEAATRSLSAALDLARELGDHREQALALQNLGRVRHACGDADGSRAS